VRNHKLTLTNNSEQMHIIIAILLWKSQH